VIALERGVTFHVRPEYDKLLLGTEETAMAHLLLIKPQSVTLGTNLIDRCWFAPKLSQGFAWMVCASWCLAKLFSRDVCVYFLVLSGHQCFDCQSFVPIRVD
jgi:hypothetical protein